jgi:hypothetical protein
MKHFGRLFHAQAAEEAQFDHPAFPGVDGRQRLQGAIQRHHVQCWFRRCDKPFVQRHALQTAPAFVISALPGVVDEHAPHQASGNPKKVGAILPSDAPGVGEAEKCLIHQCSGL